MADQGGNSTFVAGSGQLLEVQLKRYPGHSLLFG